MQQEDIVSGFVAIITLVLNLLPSITGSTYLTPTESAGLLSLAVILKAILGDITLGQPPAPVTPPVTLPPPTSQVVPKPVVAPAPAPVVAAPVAPVSEVGTYQISAITPNGQTYNGTITVGTTKAAAIAGLTAFGFTNIEIGAKQ